ncbi:MAG: MarR family winged helix-turn-helix transcriptional regulator [Pseudomonadota bacterium]
MSKLVPYDTTLHVRDHCLCLFVQRAARLLARRFDDALREVGLTNQQFSLLMSLNRPQPPGIGAVAELLGMDRTTLTAALKPLERRGLARIAVHSMDRRGRTILLTQDGEQLLAQAVPIWRDTNSTLREVMGDVDLGRLRDDLRAVA